MKVFVKGLSGKPLMPTTPARARKMLKSGKAVVEMRTPFTIRLTVETKEYTQPLTMGVDAGSKVVGVSVTTEAGEELYAAEASLRNDIVELLAERRQYRRTRRNRLRYRKPQFQNRKKKEGWLAPSIRHKIDSHLKLISKVCKLLPITKIVIETAAFDIQKIKNPNISGTEYQRGEQLDFWNIREYVLHRDGHVCQACKGKSKDKILNVHHIESRMTGGDTPGNLITLCETCHENYHSGKLKLSVKRGASFKDAVFMGIMRWALYGEAKKIYPNVCMTYGYITKNTRILNGLEKSHSTDAYCITGNLGGERTSDVFIQKFVRKSNRSLHKANLLKGGKRKANKAPYIVCGFRLFDKVSHEGKSCFVFGRRSSGYFDLRLLDGTKVHPSVNCKKLKLLELADTLLTERRRRFLPDINGEVSAPR